MPQLRELGEGAAYGGVGVIVMWVVNKLRQFSNDTEARATRRIGEMEERLTKAENKAEIATNRAEQCEIREHRLRLELIDAGVDIPKEAPEP